ncbi:MAG: hypothetical protein ACO3Q5_03780 [Ilumatobacteraceae bacterium]
MDLEHLSSVWHGVDDHNHSPVSSATIRHGNVVVAPGRVEVTGALVVDDAPSPPVSVASSLGAPRPSSPTDVPRDR